ncbi:MAG: hypothetical protein ABJB12_13620 [Pseudomonadota bacterium]
MPHPIQTCAGNFTVAVHGVGRAAVQLEGKEMRLKADLCRAQCSDGERDWELHRL